MTQPQPTPQDDASSPDAVGASIAAALGRIPSGLFVVAWRETDESPDRGMLASWVMQGGFSPPMITIAVAPSRDLVAAIDQCRPFVVNILSEQQRPLLAKFGRPAAPGENPFADLAVTRTPSGTAAIADAAAWLECRPVSQTGGGGGHGGDHIVVLARVTAAGTGAELPPLVHLRRNGLRY
jgi:flavin reductase (DIM6/NTAB) family NADH-FMN oxidoreductase RutF